MHRSPETIADSRGRTFTSGARGRLVSLVPSLTETLFEIGSGDAVVGRSDYCVRPEPRIGEVPTVGGTKTADPEKILACKPDLVLANQEENDREVVARLEKWVPVFVTFPRSVADTMALCRDLGRLLETPGGERLAEEIARELRAVARAGPARPLYTLTFVWRRPWMVAGPNTYVSDVLARCGAENVLSEAGRRYPTVSPDEIRALNPDLFVLPDEPFRFTPADARGLERTFGARAVILDGSLTNWFGARTRLALQRLPALLHGC